MTEPAVSWSEISDSLNELAGLLLSAEQPTEVLHKVTALATRTITAAASCSVTVVGDNGPTTPAAANQLAEQLDELQYANGDGPCLEVLRDGTPAKVEAMTVETRWGQYPQLALDHGVLSMLSLPLAPQGKTIGALNLYATVAHGFDDDSQRAIAELFAGQAAVTLAGAQRHAAELQLAAGLRAEVGRLLAADRLRTERIAGWRRWLATLIEELAPPLSAEQVGQVVVDATVASTQAMAALLLVRSGAAGHQRRLKLLAHHNLHHVKRDRLAQLPPGRSDLLVEVLESSTEPVVVAADELAHRDPRLARLISGHSVVAVALPRGSDAVGVLMLTYRPGAEPDADDLGYLLTVARLAAAGLERARLAAAEQAAAHRSELLGRASAALVSSVARNRALPTLTQVLVPELADWAAAHRLEPDGTLRLVDVRHVDPRRRARLHAELSAMDASLDDPVWVGAVARAQQRAYYPEVSGQVLASLFPDPERRARVAALEVTAAVILPLSSGDQTLATATVARSGGGFTNDELALIEEITRRAAVSLDNARLYQREREAALTLQRSLLPAELPTVPRLTVAARYLPGTAGTEAGGDFYDVIPLPGGGVGLAIGDVMGRGIAAAAVMGQLRAALRAYALEEHRPAALLSRLHAVVQALGTGTLTTCTYAVYDPDSQELQVATAGHLPPLLSGPEQLTRYLELDPGLPLGVDSATFAETALRLQPQTTLVLCTDGLVERRDLPLGEGMDRLAAAVDAVMLPPQAVCDHVLATLRPPDGDHSELDDDIALLVAATPPAA